MSDVVRLDVWSDIACPWCYIGSRHLTAALAEEPEGSVWLRHRAFLLQPQMPERGLPTKEFFAAKFGGDAAVSSAFDRVRAVGAEVGIRFDFEAMPVAPQTAMAHSVVRAYDDDLAQRRVLAAMYSAYFEQGLDITDVDVVQSVAADAAGETVRQVEERLTDGTAAACVSADLEEARLIGVSSVPTFVADAGVPQGGEPFSAAAAAFSGARPPEDLRGLLAAARERAGV